MSMGTWTGLKQGAAVYGYSEARGFLRPVKQGRVLGASKTGSFWHSDHRGIVGSITGTRRDCILPCNTEHVALEVEVGIGSIHVTPYGIAAQLRPSGTLYMDTYGLRQAYPWVTLRSTRPIVVRLVTRRANDPQG